MDVEFELGQQLQGHDSQVRCVTFLGDGTLVTGGLDACIIMWRRPSPTEGFAQVKKLGHHSDFIYALAPSAASPGCFYSASKDRTAVRVDAEGNPVMQFTGHEGAVCSVAERGAQLVTGSWDGTARVWDVSTGELIHTLDAGAHAVTIAVMPTGQIVTGSQDRTLRVFKDTECIHKVDDAHGDIIRGISVGSAHLVSCSNDNSIKMWSFDACEMTVLSGHQSFVYGVAHSHDGQALYSSSDDSTLKVWSLSDTSCKQSISHAGTVWQVLGLPNGDIVSTCADMIVRVWTTDPERMAAEAERQTQREMAEQAAMQAAAKGSSSTNVDAVDIKEMATTFGKKNGEIKCFREGSKTMAYSWNEGARIWDCIGEVMGSQEEKKHYPGDTVFPAGEYDFVFDVEIRGEYKRLPFNRGENHMVVAEAFCAREQINKSNTEQIRGFIAQNSGEGTPTLGGGAVQGAAPTTGKRQPPPVSDLLSETTTFPITDPVAIKEGKYEPLLKKLLEFNSQLEEGMQLSPLEHGYLLDAVEKLKNGGLKSELKSSEKDVIHLKLGSWPKDKLFPVLDLWRLFLLHPQSTDYFKVSDRGGPYLRKVVELLDSEPNTALGLCSSRYFANMFQFQTNRFAMYTKKDDIMKVIERTLMNSTNKNTRTACTTVLLNFAIYLHEVSHPPKPWEAEFAVELARVALAFAAACSLPDDADAQQRAALTIGTLLPRDKANGGMIKETCVQAGFPARITGTLAEKLGASAVAEFGAFFA